MINIESLGKWLFKPANQQGYRPGGTPMQPSDFSTLGIAVIPLAPKTKKPLVRWRDYQHRLPTATELQRWFYPGHSRNVAVICGWRGLTVLDFDDTSAYEAWVVWCALQGGEARKVASATYRVRTARGVHVYLFVANTPRCGKAEGQITADIKAVGGYVLVPPSIHPSGAAYTAMDDDAPILEIDDLSQVLPNAPDPPKPRPAPTVQVAAASNLWPLTPVEQIKESVPILSFFPDAQQTGSHWYIARCPLHDDHDPSMWIDTGRGICGCYAGCTPKPLDVIGLYARLHGLTNRDAIHELRVKIT
jgi:hypothetical protein